MSQTREILGDLVNYEEVTAIRPLDPPAIEKSEIPRFIHCPLFQKVQAKTDSAMERHTLRVKQAEERVKDSQEQIASLEAVIEGWEKEARGVSLVNRLTLDRSSTSSVERYNRDVARHNEAVEQVRRYQDRLDNAIDRHNDLVQRYNEAVAEAQERLDELNLQALSEIDHDLVAFLDRCAQVVARLSDSEAPSDQEAALETCFIGLKIYHSFGEYIDGPAARQQARQNFSILDRQFVELGSSSRIMSALIVLFCRNQSLMEANAGLYSQMADTVGSVNQQEMESLVRSLETRFNENFRTEFHYQGVVDPSRLQSIMNEMHQSVQAVNRNVQQVKETVNRAKPVAEAAAGTQQRLDNLLSEMRTNVRAMSDQMLDPHHFVRDLIDPAVIEGFYTREERSAAVSVRQALQESLGEEVLLGVLKEGSDPYALARGEQLIKDAGLLRLRTGIAQAEPHLGKLARLIQELKQDLERAQKVPSQNASQLRSATSALYLLSCIPLLGLVPALVILKKLEAYRTAFSSTIPVYHELGSELLARNKSFRTVTLIANFPAALMLAQVSKRLEEYLGQATAEPVRRGLARTK
jgi:hypothetical protein